MSGGKKEFCSGDPEIRLDLGLEQVPEDDHRDDNSEYRSHAGREQAHEAYEATDYSDDDRDNPYSGPALGTADPEEEVDDADDKEHDAESGSKTAQPHDA